MMRVDVDFNERDRHGHVVARVPGGQAARLASGHRVYLYDPLERLWAEASVARVNTETNVAAFNVDWHSFADAEVADLTVGHSHWFLGVPPGNHQWLPPSAVTENASDQANMAGRLVVTVTVTVEGMPAQSITGNSAASTQGTAVGL